MIHTPHVDWFAISTILVLLGASFVALLGAVLVPARARRPFAASVASLGFAGGLVTSIWLYATSANGHLVISGAFYRDRNILVIGGGDSAMEEAVFLTRFASKVTIVTRDPALSASKVVVDKVEEHPDISVVTNSNPAEFVGNGRLVRVVLSDTCR